MQFRAAWHESWQSRQKRGETFSHQSKKHWSQVTLWDVPTDGQFGDLATNPRLQNTQTENGVKWFILPANVFHLVE